ncbi:uncharacterized protein HD556DRAFT_1305242 [Suillus plorans]|uniref:Uncharacterized protein n=1 Tax=Suillus plorans TaxID=116603 RepID=A0A9P7J2G7_9AGAM|nr:uncharacterized protein HD556DRAFT_1305242 [Suillus plorans]KAG1799689.1 hypothetical protein HD556DRAFT_1305242 [Suillus plorans]
MSSTGPTRQALARLINNTDTAPSQRDRRERRPSEKALYQVEEAQDREDRRQGNQAKIFGTQCLFVQSIAHCPTGFKTTCDSQLPTPASCQTSDRGWQEDVLTKESGFINASHACTSNSNMSAQMAQSGSAPPMAQQKLMAARANELIKLRQVQTAHTTFEDQDDDMGDTFEENEYDGNLAPIDSQDTDADHNNVSDDEDSRKHPGYLDSSDEECNRPRNRKRRRTTEDFSEDSPSPQQYEPRLPCKIRKSKGRVAARDYEVAVQQLIKSHDASVMGQGSLEGGLYHTRN